MAPAIRVDSLSKHYKLGERQQGYKTLRESITDAVAAPFRRFSNLKSQISNPKSSDFWALKDVSFEVQPGEVVGIIGRNGAGKSTLLKILSRITEPTSGRIELRGRVGSLLEVGTGFHPELTGRENVYMNGSILGMTRREIRGKFDEIVAFAEIEEFLDTPVKRYSSGMYVRLAFAVAAHLEPEILIVDEVLAVGDVGFQRKCLTKMEDVAHHGRAILFVSHHMATVQRFCRTGIVLDGGRIVAVGPACDAAQHYLQTIETGAVRHLSTRTDRRGSQAIRLLDAFATLDDTSPKNLLVTGQRARLSFTTSEWRSGSHLLFTIYGADGSAVSNFDTRNSERIFQTSTEARLLQCHIDELMLRPGRYRINVGIYNGIDCHDHVEGAAFFDVEGGKYGDATITNASNYGCVVFRHRWNEALPQKSFK